MQFVHETRQENDGGRRVGCSALYENRLYLHIPIHTRNAEKVPQVYRSHILLLHWQIFNFPFHHSFSWCSIAKHISFFLVHKLQWSDFRTRRYLKLIQSAYSIWCRWVKLYGAVMNFSLVHIFEWMCNDAIALPNYPTQILQCNMFYTYYFLYQWEFRPEAGTPLCVLLPKK